MIAALMLGRKGSVGFPGKNLFPVLGRPLAWYPINTAMKSGMVDRFFLSTDDSGLMDLARGSGCEVIERPPELCTPQALGEDAYKHGFEQICRVTGSTPELLVLLFCNAPTFTGAQIHEAVNALRKNPNLDSAVTVSKYNMWSPLRARQITKEGILQPFVPFEFFDNQNLTCDRDSQGDAWFADVALMVVRPQNFQNLDSGLLPQKWMGKRIHPIKNEAGLDVDYEWQLPQVEWWLKKHGGYDVHQ
jgi:CMP-N-acetylneuraminic acid synthetase